MSTAYWKVTGLTRKREPYLKWEKLYSPLETKRTAENEKRVK